MSDMNDLKWHYAEGLGELALCKIEPYQATRFWDDVTCPVCVGMRATVDNALLTDRLKGVNHE